MSYVLNSGLGSAVKAGQEVQIGGSLGAAGATAVLGHIAATGGSVLGLGGAALSAAIPIVGAAIAGVTMAVQYLVANSGCGQTCIETSGWANQAEPQLQKNLAAYLSLPVPRPKSAQVLALANFDTIWARLQELCGQPGTGDAGVRCISDRQAGACKWRDAQGVCFNWFSGYRDPIANDSGVYDDSISAIASNAVSSVGSDLVASLSSASAGISPAWLALGALALLGLAVAS